ncbi:MAG: DNA polymerase I, partial [Lachnospiraceae bacterium]|nr:DNA polymerase I [Lachnospiraceae bacterium]
ERIGVICRQGALKAYGDSLTARIAELEEAIHKAAGEAFNINSPKQLGEILFEKMGLQGGKKTKTGYSTAADVLEKLAEDTPMVRDVLEYRGLTKLKSTYADGLAAFIRADGRIHTVFNQTITATGRLSSSEPNLQNIPMRTDLGRAIRKVFTAAEGCRFVDADYSQIELRVLAHLSGDENLIEAYNQAQDIHAITASKVFHVPLEEVTPALRRNAKAVNFGIVYGISAFGLSNDLSISRKEAVAYIDQYFLTYPKVKAFLDRTVAEAKERGYTVTMSGRRRPIPELKSSNFMTRSFGERAAMNSPVQGTAADVIKVAMNRVDRRLRREIPEAKMILQVHDELMVEAPEEAVPAVAAMLAEEMPAALPLAVKLEADVHDGRSWDECK